MEKNRTNECLGVAAFCDSSRRGFLKGALAGFCAGVVYKQLKPRLDRLTIDFTVDK